MLSSELLLNANEFSKGKYSTKYDGIISGNNKSYIKILKAGFFGDNYKSDRKLKNIDLELSKLSKKTGDTIFLYSSHLYYLESKDTIDFDTKLVFLLSIILILLIFYYFFQDISLLLFSSLPIAGGFALTFFIISIFKNSFGGITLAFGSTTIGIAIDYSINYLIRKAILYPDLKKVRNKIGLSLFLGFITTILAFVFLPFSRIDSLKEIAAFGIISITASYLLSWYYLQNILPPNKYKIKILELNLKFYGKKGFYAWVIIVILFSAFLPFIKFEDNLMNLDMKHKELNKRLAVIQKNFAESSDNIFLGFTGRNIDEVLSKSLSALYSLKKESKIFVLFYSGIIFARGSINKKRKAFIKANFKRKDFYASLNDSIFDRNTFEPFIKKIQNIDNEQITDIPEYINQEFSSMFVNWNNDKYLLIPVYKRDVAKRIAKVLTDQKIDFELIDLVTDGAKGLINFEKNGILLLLSSILVIYLLLLIVYKNFKYAFCSILPALSSLIICFALTVVLKNDFNIMHFVGCLLIVGIGVDYGIFITNILKEKSTTKEIKITIESNLICALSTLASFGVLALCRHNTLFSLGITMFAGILFSFLTSYLAIPYILGKDKLIQTGIERKKFVKF